MTELAILCKELRLQNLEKLAMEVEFEDKIQFLTDVLTLVSKHREANRVQRLIKGAKFTTIKTFDGFQFDPVGFPVGFDKEQLLSLEFVEENKNVLCIGAVGTGKTYLATALGVKACAKGKRVRFYRAVDLCTELADKHRSGMLGRALKQLQKLDLLIIDEVGYIPFDKTASQLLFNVLSNAYEQQSIIVTSNLEFGRWNEIFRDDRLTAALIDRLVHHAYILGFTGTSFRYREAIMNRGGESANAVAE
ncbi:MAG: ATP-binding protein [Firmicutes bacterium]|nr:ATP-binding protein [Bacillota bacterium]